MSWKEQRYKNDLDDVPTSWDGITKEMKVQQLLNVIEGKMQEVRNGSLDVSEGDRIAALVLECQLALAEFYADVEAQSRSAKHQVELVESEVSNDLSKEAADAGKKISEAALKRNALVSQDVKDARKELVEKEKEYKRWRCVYEILREAHIMFRNIAKL